MDAPAPTPADPTGSRRPRRALVIGGALVAVVAAVALAIGVFGVHTLFIDEEVSEAGPEFDSGAVVAGDPTTTLAPAADAPEGSTAETAPEAEAEPEAEPAPTTAPAPVVRTVSTGAFTGVDHPGSGTATLLSDGIQTFVRFEDDFSTDNGPDLFAVAYEGGERIELGRLKGNQGAQNYELPADVDPEAVDTVAVWCKRFDSTFTEAPLG